MQVNVYRSECQHTWPQEVGGFRYSFRPIEYSAQTRLGYLTGSTYGSGSEPFATYEVPDGTQLVETETDVYLMLPGDTLGLDALSIQGAADPQFGDSRVRRIA